MTTLSHAAREYVLTLADDEHMIGARHTRWIGLGPFLEEDLAFCSIAQDELGHAIGLYLVLTGEEGTIDELALRRSAGEYRSSWLAEWPCDDWASALVRHWMYDRAEELRWHAVAASSLTELAELVPGVRREEEFHRRHADELLERVVGADDDGVALQQVLGAMRALRPLADSLWIPPIEESSALAEGIASRPFSDMRAEWREQLDADLVRWSIDPVSAMGATVALPADRRSRSPYFAAFHAELNEVLSIDPTATW